MVDVDTTDGRIDASREVRIRCRLNNEFILSEAVERERCSTAAGMGLMMRDKVIKAIQDMI